MLGMEKVFDPETVGMVLCPLCNGEGKLPEDHDGLKVCPECEGFGIVKKKETAEEKSVEFRGVRIILPK
jgi:DnaJ-class molecular chaperone